MRIRKLFGAHEMFLSRVAQQKLEREKKKKKEKKRSKTKSCWMKQQRKYNFQLLPFK